MLILGDLACPNLAHSQKLLSAIKKCNIFENDFILCNFEGMITSDANKTKNIKLYNDESVLKVFVGKKVLFALSNNHAYDYPEDILPTIVKINNNGYETVGIKGKNAFSPKEIVLKGQKIAFFNHCWKVYTKTNPNRINNVKIYDCDYDFLYKSIKEYKEKHLDYKIICYFHWNYDLEDLPMPMHRIFAKKLIDIGVDAVLGNHSHCPQGGELYKGKPIVYGFGNFYLPSNVYFNGKLKYPNKSKITMALEIKDDGKCICHWFNTDSTDGISLILTENFNSGVLINKYSPYRSMNDDEYLKFFKRNRNKKFFVPVFTFPFGLQTKLKTNLAIIRIKTIKFLLKYFAKR